MIVIVANINGRNPLDGEMRRGLLDAITPQGVQQVIYVSTQEELKSNLIGCQAERCLLFSNFPPDCSYSKEKNPDFDQKDVEHLYNAWEADAYTTSTFLFNAMGTKYVLAGISFITGAPKFMVPEEYLKQLVGGGNVDVKHKSELINLKIPYAIALRQYIEARVKAVVSADSLQVG